MRIIAGSLRGRRLATPPAGVRPTSDRVRESLFARLGDPDGASVLDLFAGTGALGLEAFSRGASAVVFVDRAGRSVAGLKRNLDALGLAEEDVRVIRSDARSALRRLSREGARFDWVLIDPPYDDFDSVAPLLEAIVAGDLLTERAVVVVECAKRHSVSPTPGLHVDDTRSYGDTTLTWLTPDRAVRPEAEASPGETKRRNEETKRRNEER